VPSFGLLLYIANHDLLPEQLFQTVKGKDSLIIIYSAKRCLSSIFVIRFLEADFSTGFEP